MQCCVNHPDCVLHVHHSAVLKTKLPKKIRMYCVAQILFDSANLDLFVFVLQAAMQAVTQPASRTSQLASTQPKDKATITLKNFAAVSRS